MKYRTENQCCGPKRKRKLNIFKHPRPGVVATNESITINHNHNLCVSSRSLASTDTYGIQTSVRTVLMGQLHSLRKGRTTTKKFIGTKARCACKCHNIKNVRKREEGNKKEINDRIVHLQFVISTVTLRHIDCYVPKMNFHRALCQFQALFLFVLKVLLCPLAPE